MRDRGVRDDSTVSGLNKRVKLPFSEMRMTMRGKVWRKAEIRSSVLPVFNLRCQSDKWEMLNRHSCMHKCLEFRQEFGWRDTPEL